MIKLYVKSNCLGSQKAENFLKKNDIRFERINLSFIPLDEEELFKMQTVINPNIRDIINFNSDYFDNNPESKELMMQANLRDVITFIMKNIDALSFPIAVDADSRSGKVKSVFVGFNESEWKILNDENYTESLDVYYTNCSKNYIFKSCCCFDEVANDNTNILVNLNK